MTSILVFTAAVVAAEATTAPREAGDTATFDGISFVWCPPGTFTMGTDFGYFDERPAREITISKGFWIGQYEITQEQWSEVMGKNPSSNVAGESLPVETVTYLDAKAFAEKLSDDSGAAYRLPTEAEWEYACRAGTTTKYSFGDSGDDADAYAWYRVNSAGGPQSVGEKKPNAWGIYDMHGNVAEWCQDWYQAGYDPDDTVDPQGPEQIRDAVVRGGGWPDSVGYLRSGARYRMNFIFARNHIGLRIVREAEDKNE